MGQGNMILGIERRTFSDVVVVPLINWPAWPFGDMGANCKKRWSRGKAQPENGYVFLIDLVMTYEMAMNSPFHWGQANMKISS